MFLSITELATTKQISTQKAELRPPMSWGNEVLRKREESSTGVSFQV